MKIKEAYRTGRRQAEVEGAEKLVKHCTERYGDKEEQTPEGIRCRENRISRLSECNEFYKSLNFFGKTAYITGLCLKRIEVIYMIDTMDEFSPSR